jgi:hypothetical protein
MRGCGSRQLWFLALELAFSTHPCPAGCMRGAAEDISLEDLRLLPTDRAGALRELRYHARTKALIDDANARTWSTIAMPLTDANRLVFWAGMGAQAAQC